MNSKLVVFFVMLAALPATLFAQGLTGSISGSVTDQSAAAIPGADITLVNVQTSQTRQAKSDGNGDFVFTQILRGTFRLTVSSKGFKNRPNAAA